jgi:DNA-binding response OmpR family regulator
MKSTNQFLRDFQQCVKGLFTTDTTKALSKDSIIQDDESDQVWLIIEDDPNVRQMLGTLVQYWGRKPLVFEDGHQAMKWVENFREGRYDGPIPELTLSDVRMPGPHGHKVCGELRKIPELAEMPIIIRSAWQFTPEEKQSVMQTSQADRLIVYPYPKLDEFKAIIDSVLEKRREKVGNQQA